MVQDVLHIDADGEVVFVTAIAAEEAAHRPATHPTAAKATTATAAARATAAAIAAIILSLPARLPVVVRRRAEAKGFRDVQIDHHHSWPIAEVARDDLLARQRVRIEVAKWRMNDDRVA